MTVLTRAQLQQLTNHQADATVSLFMPVQPTYAHLGDNLARLERLIESAERRLVGHGLQACAANDLLEPFRQLRDHELFWCATGHGLAAFASRELFRAYRVPWQLTEHVVVDHHFSILPLLPLLEEGSRFYILALQEESARLYEASEHSIQQISLPLRVLPEAESLMLCNLADNRKKQTNHFCRAVGDAVNEVLQGQDAPLILACVGYLAQMYQANNHYEHLLKAKVPGNPRLWNVDELRLRAWEHVVPVFRRQRERALKLYCDAIGSSRAACDVKEIVAAADEGRIRILLLTDQREAAVESPLHETNGAKSFELLSHAVTQTLNHGGTVYRVDRMPNSNSPIAALLRS